MVVYSSTGYSSISFLKIDFKMALLGPVFIVSKILKSVVLTFQIGIFSYFPSRQLRQFSANIALQFIKFL